MTTDWIDVKEGVTAIYIGDRIRKAVLQSQAERCDVQGHDYENCCTVALQVYQKCRWCGKTERF